MPASVGGVGGAWLIGHGTDPQIFVMTCIVMGAVMVTFPIVVYPPAYNLFQAGALLAFATGLAVTPMEYGLVLAIGFVLMAIFGSLIGYGMGNQVIAGMRLSIENKQLAMRLEERGAALEAANRELEIQSHTDPLTGCRQPPPADGFCARRRRGLLAARRRYRSFQGLQ
jgi:hypothetical protein